MSVRYAGAHVHEDKISLYKSFDVLTPSVCEMQVLFCDRNDSKRPSFAGTTSACVLSHGLKQLMRKVNLRGNSVNQ